MYLPLSMSLGRVLLEDLSHVRPAGRNISTIEMSAMFSWFASNHFLNREEIDKFRDIIGPDIPEEYVSLYEIMCEGVYFDDNKDYSRLERDIMTVGIYLDKNHAMKEDDIHRLLDSARSHTHMTPDGKKDSKSKINADFVIEVDE